MKFKKALLALVASIGLVAPLAAYSAGEAQVVEAKPNAKVVSNSPTPKILRGKWYEPGYNKRTFLIKKDTADVVEWGTLNPVTSISADWKKVNKNQYNLTTREHYKDGSISYPMGNKYITKKIKYHKKTYRALIIGFIDEKDYRSYFNRRVNKKVAVALLKKSHLNRKVIKSAIKNLHYV